MRWSQYGAAPRKASVALVTALLIIATVEAAPPDYGVMTGPTQVFQCQSAEFTIPPEYQNLSPGGYNVTFSGSNWAGFGSNGNSFIPAGSNTLIWTVDVPAGVVFQLKATPWPVPGANSPLRTYKTQTYLVNTGSSNSCLPSPSIRFDPQILLTPPPSISTCTNVTFTWTTVNSTYTGPYRYWITLDSNPNLQVVPGVLRNYSQMINVPGGASATSYTWLVDWPPGVVVDNYFQSNNVLLGLPSFTVQNGTSFDCIPDGHGGAAYRSTAANTTTLSSASAAQSGAAPSLPSNNGGNAASSNGSTGSTSNKSSSNAGAIAGGIVGGLAALAALIAGIIFWRRRQRRQASMNDEHSQGGFVPNEKRDLPATPHDQPWANYEARSLPDTGSSSRGGNLNPSIISHSPSSQATVGGGGGGDTGIQHREKQLGVQHRPKNEASGGTVNW